MTDEQIIEMAVQAGFKHPNPHDGYMGLAYDRRDGTDTGSSLEAFAKLIAQHEREECAKVCEDNATDLSEGDWDSACNNCATHIRDRGEA